MYVCMHVWPICKYQATADAYNPSSEETEAEDQKFKLHRGFSQPPV